MILKIIYQLITLYLIIILFYSVFKEQSRMMKITAAASLIPFILRFLMIK